MQPLGSVLEFCQERKLGRSSPKNGRTCPDLPAISRRSPNAAKHGVILVAR
jgi:hypothetical protein